MEIFNLENLNKLGSVDIQSIINVLIEFDKHQDVDAEFTGFNFETGTAYIALYNGIELISKSGNQVKFIVYDYYNDKEKFFSTYKEAKKYIDSQE